MIPEFQLPIKYFTEPDGLMIDVGANKGGSFMPFARKGWKVIAIEPLLELANDLLRRTVSLKNVIVINTAISDRVSKDVPFYTTHESDGMGALHPFRPAHRKTSLVNVTTLKHIVAQQNIRQVDFLKVDAEGFDLMVLKGFPFNKIKPKLIEVEFGNVKTKHIGYTADELYRYLEDQDYRVIVSEWAHAKYVGGKFEHKWLGYRKELTDEMYWGNMFAVSKFAYPRLKSMCGL